MATIYSEFDLDCSAEKAWSALRDFGGLRERLVPGFVKDCRLDPANERVRIVTFFNDTVLREKLVGLHEPTRRLAYAVIDGGMVHHSASAQILPNGATRCRFVWITDVLPDEAAIQIGAMMEQGAAAIKNTLER